MKPSDSRRSVAREAARLLYTGAVKEYKQAKEEAARNLGVGAIPSNFDIAMELDLLAEEREGESRKELLLHMRMDALALMTLLKGFEPRLIGSVWRGTVRRGSDMDIVTYALRLDQIVERLKSSGYSIKEVREEAAPDRGKSKRSQHVIVKLENGIEAEVVVRPPEERDEIERCDIYGDVKSGLSLSELEKLMRADPLRKFVPARKQR